MWPVPLRQRPPHPHATQAVPQGIDYTYDHVLKSRQTTPIITHFISDASAVGGTPRVTRAPGGCEGPGGARVSLAAYAVVPEAPAHDRRKPARAASASAALRPKTTRGVGVESRVSGLLRMRLAANHGLRGRTRRRVPAARRGLGRTAGSVWGRAPVPITRAVLGAAVGPLVRPAARAGRGAAATASPSAARVGSTNSMARARSFISHAGRADARHSRVASASTGFAAITTRGAADAAAPASDASTTDATTTMAKAVRGASARLTRLQGVVVTTLGVARPT